MEYSIKAHPTKYKGTLFRSRLEARWAAFFDLAGWEWQYEPIDLDGWTPDFYIKIPCGHSDCPAHHPLFVEVKPYSRIEQFNGHECMMYPFGHRGNKDLPMEADASAAFGIDPSVVYWEMAHGAGGGIETNLDFWLSGKFADELWVEAGNITRYQPKENIKAKAKPGRQYLSPLDTEIITCILCDDIGHDLAPLLSEYGTLYLEAATPDSYQYARIKMMYDARNAFNQSGAPPEERLALLRKRLKDANQSTPNEMSVEELASYIEKLRAERLQND